MDLLKLATAAHAGTSFVPEQRGRQYVADLDAHLASVREWIASTAPADMVDALAQEYAEGYRRRWVAWMHAKGRCVSPMIAGPSKFPVRRMEKRNATEMRRLDDLSRYERHAKRRISKRIERANRPEDPQQAVRDEIAKMERLLEAMKASNAIIRRKKLTDDEKIAAIVEQTGLGEATARRIVTVPDFAGRLGFPGYELTSLRGKIERRKATLRVYETAPAPAEPVRAWDAPEGVEVVEDVDDDRLRLIFPGKPDEAVRAMLKRHGFRWSRAHGAWQRQLTTNARIAARQVLATLDGAA